MLKGQAKKDYQREYMRGYMRDRRLKMRVVKTPEMKSVRPIVTHPTGAEFAEGLPIFEIPSVTYTFPALDADGNLVYEDT